MALITANIGKSSLFEPWRNWAEQDYECDEYRYGRGFIEQLPFPLPNLNDRLVSKYVKIMTHRFLPNYDAYVWVDSSVEIVSNEFVSYMIKSLRDRDVVICEHPDRNNVFTELEYIAKSIEDGKEYLTKRYANEPIDEEMTFYKNNEITREHGLLITRFFARRNTRLVNEAFNDWWMRVLEFMNFDQAMLTYIWERHALSINCNNYHDTVNKYLKVHKHD